MWTSKNRARYKRDHLPAFRSKLANDQLPPLSAAAVLPAI